MSIESEGRIMWGDFVVARLEDGWLVGFADGNEYEGVVKLDVEWTNSAKANGCTKYVLPSHACRMSSKIGRR